MAVPKAQIPYERYDNGINVPASVVSTPERSEEIVTYSAYMGGDIGESRIVTNRPDLPSVLIYGDSFTNPIETILWTSFNETRSLDFRHYDEKSLGEYLCEYQPDIVICVRDETVFFSSDGNGLTQ